MIGLQYIVGGFASQSNKTNFDENSSDEGSRVVRKNTEREELKIIIKFREADEDVN